MSWLFLAAMALAKPTGLVETLGSIPQDAGPLAGGTATLSIDVQMVPVDGIPMTQLKAAKAAYVLVTDKGVQVLREESTASTKACRVRMLLDGPWLSDAEVTVRVKLTGAQLPMSPTVLLPEGARKVDDAWVLTAPKGAVVVDLPACG